LPQFYRSIALNLEPILLLVPRGSCPPALVAVT
jgi:hypothetical protein